MNAKEIKKCISDIGIATIRYDETIHDYLFNGKTPSEIPLDYIAKLKLKFDKLLANQLKGSCDEKLLRKYIDYANVEKKKLVKLLGTHRGSFVFLSSKKTLSDYAKYSHEDINSIVSTQIATLNEIITRLFEEIEFVDYRTDEDHRKEPQPQDANNISQIKFTSVGKATFKLGKKDALMLLYILEDAKLLEFKNAPQRNKFIEQNFEYTEIRSNPSNGKAMPMLEIDSDISKLNNLDRDEVKTNNKSLNRLQAKLTTALLEYKFTETKKKS